MQRTIFEGHPTLLQAALDDPGDPLYWVEVVTEDGLVTYEPGELEVVEEDDDGSRSMD